MESNSPSTRISFEQFWDRYFAIIRQFRVPEKSFPWYRRHVQSFIRDNPNLRLQDRRPEHIQD